MFFSWQFSLFCRSGVSWVRAPYVPLCRACTPPGGSCNSATGCHILPRYQILCLSWNNTRSLDTDISNLWLSVCFWPCAKAWHLVQRSFEGEEHRGSRMTHDTLALSQVSVGQCFRTPTGSTSEDAQISVSVGPVTM